MKKSAGCYWIEYCQSNDWDGIHDIDIEEVNTKDLQEALEDIKTELKRRGVLE